MSPLCWLSGSAYADQMVMASDRVTEGLLEQVLLNEAGVVIRARVHGTADSTMATTDDL